MRHFLVVFPARGKPWWIGWMSFTRKDSFSLWHRGNSNSRGGLNFNLWCWWRLQQWRVCYDCLEQPVECKMGRFALNIVVHIVLLGFLASTQWMCGCSLLLCLAHTKRNARNECIQWLHWGARCGPHTMVTCRLKRRVPFLGEVVFVEIHTLSVSWVATQ